MTEFGHFWGIGADAHLALFALLSLYPGIAGVIEGTHVAAPREPMPEMVVEGQIVFLDNGYTHGELNDSTLRKAYRAMLAAAEGK